MRLTWDMYWKARTQQCCASKCEYCPYLPKNKGGRVSDNAVEVDPQVIVEIKKIELGKELNPKFSKEYTLDQQAAIVQRLRFWRQQERPIGIDRATLNDFRAYFGYDN